MDYIGQFSYGSDFEISLLGEGYFGCLADHQVCLYRHFAQGFEHSNSVYYPGGAADPYDKALFVAHVALNSTELPRSNTADRAVNRRYFIGQRECCG